MNLFDWAKFRTAKGGLKIHAVWDDTLGLPDYVNITQAKLHDSKGLENQLFPKSTIIVKDVASRLVTVYKEDENKVIHLISNQVERQAVTVADLYKSSINGKVFREDGPPERTLFEQDKFHIQTSFEF